MTDAERVESNDGCPESGVAVTEFSTGTETVASTDISSTMTDVSEPAIPIYLIITCFDPEYDDISTLYVVYVGYSVIDDCVTSFFSTPSIYTYNVDLVDPE